MKIFIKFIDNSKYEIDIDESYTIIHLKDILSQKFNININQIRLIFKGSPLSDDNTIFNSNIKENSNIHFLFQLA